IISQHFAKSAGLKKVSLHVNDKKCAVPRIEFERIGFGINAQSPIQLHGIDPCGGRELKASFGREHWICHLGSCQRNNMPFVAIKMGRRQNPLFRRQDITRILCISPCFLPFFSSSSSPIFLRKKPPPAAGFGTIFSIGAKNSNELANQG